MSKHILILTLVLSVGCGDDDTGIDGSVDAGTDAVDEMSVPDLGDDVAQDVVPDAEPPATCDGTALLDMVDGETRFALISTDFTSTSVGLLNANGEDVVQDWHNSGVAAPGLVAALGGDVALPTRQPDGRFFVIDRFGTNVVSQFCMPSGNLVGQVAVGADYNSNPQDVAFVDATHGWVSRYEPNLADNSDGSDLVEFNPTTMLLTGNRIDLSSFKETVSGMNPQGAVDLEVVPRPSRLSVVGTHVVVGLERLPVDLFGMDRGFGEGTVAIVDTADGSVDSHVLTGLANCGQVQPSPDAENEVLVTCKGYSNAGFGDDVGERENAGFVFLSIAADGSVTETARWNAKDNAEQALAVWNSVAMPGHAVAGVDFAPFGSDDSDRVIVTKVDAATQATFPIDGASASGLGQGAWAGSVLLVPEGAVGVHRFTVDANSDFVAHEIIMPGVSALPPAAIGLIGN